MRKKQRISLLMVTILTFQLFCLGFPASAETDFNGHWAEKMIVKWMEAGKIHGYEDGTFRPDNHITRAEFTTILSNLTAKNNKEETEHRFDDVTQNDWYYDSVMKLLALGILTETESFNPEAYITRQDAMTMAGKAFYVRSFDTASIEQFSDYQDISKDAQMFIAGFIDMGYIEGYEDNTIRPNAPITRSESVKLLDNLDIVHEKKSMKGIMDRIYEGVNKDMPQTKYEAITDENAEYFLGLKNLESIEEALASDAVMRPVAHSVCLVRAKEGTDIEALKEEIRTSVNPFKWVCTGIPREEIIVENRGNLILLILDKTAPQEIANSFLALELE